MDNCLVFYCVSDINFRQEHLVATAMHSALVLQPHWISSLHATSFIKPSLWSNESSFPLT